RSLRASTPARMNCSAERVHHYSMSLQTVQIPVRGMTCGNCARTVERKLSASPGVTKARVDLAGGTATVEFDADRTKLPDLVRALVAAIEELGYGVPQPEPGQDIEEQTRQREFASVRRRLWLAAIFAAPVVVLGMWPGLMHLRAIPWLQLALTIPVVSYAGAP